MKIAGNLVSALLFVAIVALAPGVVHDSLADQQEKSQIAQINHIMYGIFSVDVWKTKLADIMVGEIGKLDLKLTATKLKVTIENELTAVIDQLNAQIKESNKSSLGGRIKQLLINIVVNVENIKKGVPRYADAIINELGKPETQESVKAMAITQLKTYLNKSFTEQNRDPVNAVLQQTGTDSVAAATQKLNDEIAARDRSLEWRSYALMGLACLLFAWAGIARHRTKFTISLLFATLIILLGIGVSIPMIDLEAKISEMSFVLIGHKISFENQILYFQSKSVLNVFWLMITHHALKMKAVGVLLITFSIVFPILKMSASVSYFFSERMRQSRVVQFLAFKIGKWSMADVMVIAIFMAYIGFDGIVEAQFNKMKGAVPHDVTLFTTNGTTLQLGYFIFITYVLLALVLSSYVHAAPPAAPKS